MCHVSCDTVPKIVFHLALFGYSLLVTHGQILCRMVKYGLRYLTILTTFHNLSQCVFFLLSRVSLCFCVVLDKEIYELCMGKAVEESDHGLF